MLRMLLKALLNCLISTPGQFLSHPSSLVFFLLFGLKINGNTGIIPAQQECKPHTGSGNVSTYVQLISFRLRAFIPKYHYITRACSHYYHHLLSRSYTLHPLVPALLCKQVFIIYFIDSNWHLPEKQFPWLTSPTLSLRTLSSLQSLELAPTKIVYVLFSLLPPFLPLPPSFSLLLPGYLSE
jgi:hypothetical protein